MGKAKTIDAVAVTGATVMLARFEDGSTKVRIRPAVPVRPETAADLATDHLPVLESDL